MLRLIKVCYFPDSKVNSLFDSSATGAFHPIGFCNIRIYDFIAFGTGSHMILSQIGKQSIICFNCLVFKCLLKGGK